MTEDSFQYALENTRVLLPPRGRLETFGTSVLNFTLITEEMDAVHQSHIREGRIHAERPQVLTPTHLAQLMVEGFGDEARSYAEMVQQKNLAFLRYGFRIRKDDTRFYEVHEPLHAVTDRVLAEVKAKDEPLSAVLTGVDDGWEVALLKFMIDVIQSSAPGHVRDFRQRGLL